MSTNAEVPEKITGLIVVDDKCSTSGLKGEICVEGDSIEDVQGVTCRELALKKATTMGLNRPGFSGSGWTEWVDASGNPLRGDAFKATTPADRRVQIHYPVQAGI